MYKHIGIILLHVYTFWDYSPPCINILGLFSFMYKHFGIILLHV